MRSVVGRRVSPARFAAAAWSIFAATVSPFAAAARFSQAMTDQGQRQQANPDPNAAAQTLGLRARPQPVTRINRKVVIGAAAVLLCLISFIVLLALKPPSLRVAGPPELFNVEHKPVTDALSKLPASYDGVKPEKKVDTGKQPPTPLLPVPELQLPEHV